MEDFYQLKKHLAHFISKDGYVFTNQNGKDVRCDTKLNENGQIIVWVHKKPFNLLFLMLEYFFPEYTPNFKVNHSRTADLRIPVAAINLAPINFVGYLSKEDEIKLIKFGCEEKARFANTRSQQQITGVEVYEILKSAEFHCVYCNKQLQYTSWHLDHFTSLSRGGSNDLRNLVASCKRCNIMKREMDGFQFVRHCIKVIMKNKLEKCMICLKEEEIEELKEYILSKQNLKTA